MNFYTMHPKETRGQFHAARTAHDRATSETRAQARAARELRAENLRRHTRAFA